MGLVVPLLVTALIHFAFGSVIDGSDLATVSIQVADLDAGSARAGDLVVGRLLVEHLGSAQLASLFTVTPAADEQAARAAIDRGVAGVAVRIPEHLTATVVGAEELAVVTIYRDPALSIGPSIVTEVVQGFLDGFNGSRIAADVTVEELRAAGAIVVPWQAREAAASFAGWFASAHDQRGDVLEVRHPAGRSSVASIIGRVMAGMMIFFVFFTAANAATSILREDEDGTLGRLRSTPTPARAVMAGKFAAIALTLLVQVVVLVAAAALVFGIDWGGTLPVALATGALVVVATGFGLWLMSLVRSSRQSGQVIGVVLTLSAMAGGLMTTGFGDLPEDSTWWPSQRPRVGRSGPGS